MLITFLLYRIINQGGYSRKHIIWAGAKFLVSHSTDIVESSQKFNLCIFEKISPELSDI